MPSLNEWPREIKRGPLRGQTFSSQEEYDEARAAVVEAPEQDRPPDLTGDGPPGVTPPTRQRGRPPRGRVTKEMVYSILFPLNLGLYMIPPTRQDALNDDELSKLSEAVAKVAAVNKHVERAILGATEGSAYVELAIVVGAIAVRRAAIHGLLPREFGGAVGSMFGMGDLPEQPATEPTGDGYATTPNGLVVPAVGVPVA